LDDNEQTEVRRSPATDLGAEFSESHAGNDRPVSFYDDKRLRGARIGCSELLLLAESKKAGWSFRLLSPWGDSEWLTGWVHLKQPEDLRTARQAKVIRDRLRGEYRGEADSLLDRAIGIFQDHTELFRVEVNQTQPYAGDTNDSGHQVPWPDLGEPDCSYGSLESLYVEIRGYLSDHLDLPDERYYDVVACWVMDSWRQQDFETSPYLGGAVRA
jgi:hypothetical protein